jgi:hypothetical protein
MDRKNFKYDYQYGYCHYFAYSVMDYMKKKFPGEDVCYYLLVSEEKVIETDEVIQHNLIHVYIKIGDNFIDSNGIHDYSEIQRRVDEYETEAVKFLADVMEIIILEGESDDIPEMFFVDNDCDTTQVQKDLKRFKSNPEIKQFLQKRNLF